MKNFKLSIAYLAMFAMIFTSCSKEETGGTDSDMAQLSFGALVTDLVTNRASKQAIGDIPACSDDAPAYVTIVLTQGGTNVVGSQDEPHMVNLAPGQLFTVEDDMLELFPGTYTLDHFAVYNMAGENIWIAPRAGSELAGFVDATLPMDIDLRAGVKKYVDVPVLCYDQRDVNEYGYLFFELNAQRALQFCFFLNYCPPNGRHYTANYNVSIWRGTDATGVPLYSDVTNVTGQYDNGDYYASPLCFALPDNSNTTEDYLYYEITLLDWPGNYGTVTPNTTITGTLSKQDILDNFDGEDNINYEHLAFGCPTIPGGEGPGNGNGGGPGDGGGEWPGDGQGCETAFMIGDNTFIDLNLTRLRWGWAEHVTSDQTSFTAGFYAAAGQNDITRGFKAGDIIVNVSESGAVTVELDLADDVSADVVHIYFSDTSAPTTIAPGQYGFTDDNPVDGKVYNFTTTDGDFWLIVHAEVCAED